MKIKTKNYKYLLSFTGLSLWFLLALMPVDNLTKIDQKIIGDDWQTTGSSERSYYQHETDNWQVNIGDKIDQPKIQVEFATKPENSTSATEKKITFGTIENNNWWQNLSNWSQYYLGWRNNNSQIIQNNNQLLLPEVWPGVDARYQILGNQGIKEELVIKGNQDVSDIYEFNLETDRGVKIQKSDGENQWKLPAGVYYFTDEQGNYLAHFLPLIATDSNSNETEKLTLTITPKPNQANQYVMKLTIDLDWLTDSNRQYPVIIDPSIVHDTTTIFNTSNQQDRTVVKNGPRVEIDTQQDDTGTGADGALTVSSGTFDLNTQTNGNSGRTVADAVNFSVTTNTNANQKQITLSSTPTGLTAGDEVLIINLQGTSSDNSHVGEYETKRIESISTNTLTLTNDLKFAYDGTTQKIMVQRVPNYTNISVSSGAIITADGWDGTKGGVLFFRANGIATITGSINMNTKGYRGAQPNPAITDNGNQNANGNAGESYGGTGGRSTIEVYNGGAGGGGAIHQSGAHYPSGGGGASFGTAGERAITWTSGSNAPLCYGGAGQTYGLDNMSRIYLGSGGGSGGSDSSESTGTGGRGGNGGGLIWLSVNDLRVSGGINANGEAGQNHTSNYAAGGGGGSGGLIKLHYANGNLGSSLVTATGGSRSSGAYGGSNGGAGGSGRIALFGNNTTGASNPVVATTNYKTDYGVYNSPVMDMGAGPHNINNLTWTEKGVKTGHGETLSDSNNLTTQLNFNETSGVTASNNAGTCGTSCNGELMNFTNTTTQDALYNSGWTANNRWGAGALNFDGSNDYVRIPDNDSFSFGSGDWTMETWVRFNNIANDNYQVLAAQFGGDWNNRMIWYLDNRNSQNRPGLQFSFDVGGTWYGVSQNVTNGIDQWSAGQWYHVVLTRTGSDWKMYRNGVLIATNNSSVTMPNFSGYLTLGGEPNENKWLNGAIDSFRIYKGRGLGEDEIRSNYQAGNIQLQTRTGATSNPDDGTWEAWKPSGTGVENNIDNFDNSQSNWNWDNQSSNALVNKNNDILIKTEGAGSMKITAGNLSSDTNTVGLWHLDEASGSGAYLKDSSGNNNNGTPTGTNIVNGIDGKARKFNGNSDYISVSNANLGLNNQISVSIEGWFYINNTTSDQRLIQKQISDGWNSILLMIDSSGKLNFSLQNDTLNQYPTWVTSEVLKTGWHYLACTFSKSSINNNDGKIYIDGIQKSTNYTANGYASNFVIEENSNNLIFGMRPITNNYFFDGQMDEIRISNSARTADEIAENYRLGKDHQLNKTLNTPMDWSNQSLVTMDVAGDQLGTTMYLIAGESDYANYEPDTNTIGLWHLEETNGSGIAKDSSSIANNGTTAGTTLTDGKIGRSMQFNGSSDYVSMPDSQNYDFGANNFTIEYWEYRTDANNNRSAITRNNNGYTPFLIGYASNNNLLFYASSNGSNWDIANEQYMGTINLNRWNHFAIVRNGNTFSLFYNGKIVNQFTSSGTILDTSGNLQFGRYSGGNYFIGKLDEVRISNIARSADDIRQAYEVGARMHKINIDFAANLDSSNGIINDNTDLDLTINAVAKGLERKAANIFAGEKLIIREMVDGTQYQAQGTVGNVDAYSGVINLISWDSGSTFPSGGYTINADVFKWQKEYWDVSGSLPIHRNTINKLTVRLNNSVKNNWWLDNLQSVSNYMSDPTGSLMLSADNRYLQYRVISTTTDSKVSPAITGVTLNYVSDLTIKGGSSINSYINNFNKNNFDLSVYGITLTDSGTSITGQVSFDQTNWHDLGTLTSPVNDTTITATPDLTAWSDFPVADGETTIYVKAKTTTSQSGVKNFKINKDLVNPTIDIANVAGDPNAPYFDPTNDNSTVIILNTSTDTAGCKWDESDMTYVSMAHNCASSTNCESNLSGWGNHTVFIKCMDNAGNISTVRQVEYTVGGVGAISGVTTNDAYLNYENRQHFNINIQGVTASQTGQIVAGQGSWNYTNDGNDTNDDWFDFTTVASPVNNATLIGYADVTSWTGYPGDNPSSDGVKNIFIRANIAGINSSNVLTLTVEKYMTIPNVNTIVSVAGDTTIPYLDKTNDGNTTLIYNTNGDTNACRWDESDQTYSAMTHTCNSINNCNLNLSGTGNKTVYLRCHNPKGNVSTGSFVLNYTISGVSDITSLSSTSEVITSPGTPVFEQKELGSGKDGEVRLNPTIDTVFNLNNTNNWPNNPTTAHAVKFWRNNNADGTYFGRAGDNKIVVDGSSASGLKANSSCIINDSNESSDEILIINLQGSNSDFVNVGNFETHYLKSISENSPSSKTTLELCDNLQYSWDGSTQKILVQRVPQFTSLIIGGDAAGSATLTADAWNGGDNLTNLGGVVFVRINNKLLINSDGYIDMTGKGYRGGTQAGSGFNSGGQGGEAFCGIGGNGGANGVSGSTGAGGGGAGLGNNNISIRGANGICGGGGGTRTQGDGNNNQPGGSGSSTGGAGGGGAAHYAGGGGGYGTFGYGNNANNGGTNVSGAGIMGGGGGGTYGTADLSKLYFGAGGGRGGNWSTTSGLGGAGGGIIFISADKVDISGTINNKGTNGTNAQLGGSGSYTGAGGGGAGGSVKINTVNANLGVTKIVVDGGIGGLNLSNGSMVSSGANGGTGRIAVNYLATVSGSTNPNFNNQRYQATNILNNENNGVFNITASGITAEEAGQTVVLQGSWNYTNDDNDTNDNWYDISTVATPINNYTFVGQAQTNSWIGYPGDDVSSDGIKTLFIRVSMTGVNSSNASALNIEKYMIIPTLDSIVSVAGDDIVPYYDSTNNGQTLVVYNSSADTTMCRWHESDVSYPAMTHTCESKNNCTLNLSGYGPKDVYFNCRNAKGNFTTSSYHLPYYIGGISISNASTSQTAINNLNKNSFNLQANGVIAEETPQTIYAQGSWNQTDWYDFTTTAAPAGNITLSRASDLTTWNNYPADGNVNLYVKATNKSTYDSHIKTITIDKDTIDPVITNVVSVASDTDAPYFDPTNNKSTVIKIADSADMGQCRWDVNDVDVNTMSNVCESTTLCDVNLEGQGPHTVYIACTDIHGNKSNHQQVNYSVSVQRPQPLGWRYTREIKLDPPTADDKQVVRVELNPNNFDYDNAREGGSSIKFYDRADGKLLDYWLEKWDDKGTSVFWVKVPFANQNKIFMYYGNSSGMSNSGFSNVFSKEYSETGLLGRWHLDEGTGVTAGDNSGNSKNLTLYNGPTWASNDGGQWYDQGETRFDSGSAANLDGNNDYLMSSANLGLSGNPALSICSWIKWTGTIWSNDYTYAVGNNSSGATNQGLALTVRNGQPALDFWNTRYRATKFLATNTWYFVCATKSPGNIGTTSKILVNGEEVTAALEGTDALPNIVDAPVTIGQGGNNSYFNGQIDEVRIYNRVLSNDEIRALYERRAYNSTRTWTKVGGVRPEMETLAGQTDWWNTDWQTRSALHIFNTNNSNELTNYQVVFNLDSKFLVNEGKIRSDLNDLRFIDSDGVTQIPYFVQNQIGDIDTKIIIKVPSIPANSRKVIYAYFGNPTAANVSQSGVLEFYDNFDDGAIDIDRWPTRNTDIYLTEHDGYLQMTGIRGGNYYLQSTPFATSNTLPIIIEAQSYTTNIPTDGWSPISWWRSTNSGMSILEMPGLNGGRQYSWSNKTQIDKGQNKPLAEKHITSIILPDNLSSIVKNNYEYSYFANWQRDNFDGSSGTNYLRIGARPDNYDPGSIQTMDGRVDWVMARKYTYPEPRVGVFKTPYTIKQGEIGTETWTGTIYLEDPVTLLSGAVLTIQPGTVVKFNQGAYLLATSGQIVAEGTNLEPIIFTSWRDDTKGNMIAGSDGAAVAGDWKGVYVMNTATGSFAFCDVNYGGQENSINGHNFRGMINAYESDITVVNTVFNNSANADVFAKKASPVIERNNLGDSPYGLYIDADNTIVANPIRYNSFVNTTLSAIYIDNLPDTNNGNGPGLTLRHNDIDSTNHGFYIQNRSGATIRGTNAENTVDARENAFQNISGYMCYFDTAAGNCKFDRTNGGAILYDTNSAVITAANGGEILMAGEQYNITWNFNNETTQGDHINLYLSTNSGEEFDQTIVTDWKCDGSSSGSGCNGNTGSYNWIAVNHPSDQARIKISLRNTSDNVLVEDISDSNFSIKSIVDELSDNLINVGARHQIKLAISEDSGNYINDSLKVTFPAEFDLSLTAADVSASGGDVTWSTNELISGQTITFPFTGTLSSADGQIILTIGDSNLVINPSNEGTYPILVTIHDSQDGSGPYIDRLGTQVIINNGIGFNVNVASVVEFSMRDENDLTDISTLSFGELPINQTKDVSHLIKVSSNSYNGYTVTAQESTEFIGPNNSTFTKFNATNADPQPWSSPPTNTTSYYGYHTNDNTLGTGTTNRFTFPNRWAAMTTTASEVAYSPVMVRGENTKITYRLEATPYQTEGYYETTIMYICIPSF